MYHALPFCWASPLHVVKRPGACRFGILYFPQYSEILWGYPSQVLTTKSPITPNTVFISWLADTDIWYYPKNPNHVYAYTWLFIEPLWVDVGISPLLSGERGVILGLCWIEARLVATLGQWTVFGHLRIWHGRQEDSLQRGEDAVDILSFKRRGLGVGFWSARHFPTLVNFMHFEFVLIYFVFIVFWSLDHVVHI